MKKIGISGSSCPSKTAFSHMRSCRKPFIFLAGAAWVCLISGLAPADAPVATSLPAATQTGNQGTALLTPAERDWLAAHTGQIRIGISEIPPQILHSNDTPEGMSIDYVRLLEQKLGCRFVLVPFGSRNDVYAAAKNRQIDVVLAAQQNQERQDYLLFTEPYIETPTVIIVRNDRPADYTLTEMKNRHVAVPAGSLASGYLNKIYPDIRQHFVEDELAGLIHVSMGEVDATISELSRASYYIEKGGITNLRVAGKVDLKYQTRFGVRSDWPILRGILEKGLASIRENERHEIHRRWIHVSENNLFTSRTFWISSGAGLILIVLTVIGFALWNRSLRRIVHRQTSQLQHELAERQRTETEVCRINRALQTINDCNQSLFRATNEQELIESVCRVVVESGGYRLAWVGYALEDEGKTVRPVA